MFPAAENNAKYSLCHDSAITERTYNNNGQRNVFMPSLSSIFILIYWGQKSPRWSSLIFAGFLWTLAVWPWGHCTSLFTKCMSPTVLDPLQRPFQELFYGLDQSKWTWTNIDSLGKQQTESLHSLQMNDGESC